MHDSKENLKRIFIYLFYLSKNNKKQSQNAICMLEEWDLTFVSRKSRCKRKIYVKYNNKRNKIKLFEWKLYQYIRYNFTFRCHNIVSMTNTYITKNDWISKANNILKHNITLIFVLLLKRSVLLVQHNIKYCALFRTITHQWWCDVLVTFLVSHHVKIFPKKNYINYWRLMLIVNLSCCLHTKKDMNCQLNLIKYNMCEIRNICNSLE